MMCALNITVWYSLRNGLWLLDLGNSKAAAVILITPEEARQCVELGVRDITPGNISKMIPPQQVLFI